MRKVNLRPVHSCLPPLLLRSRVRQLHHASLAKRLARAAGFRNVVAHAVAVAAAVAVGTDQYIADTTGQPLTRGHLGEADAPRLVSPVMPLLAGRRRHS